MSALTPLPGRECGTCTSCCVELAIDAPELKKPDGCACPHLLAGAGCGIYAGRPSLCRDWYCGWRMGALGDDMRPDRFGVLLIPELGQTPGYRKGGLRLVLTRGDRDLLRDGALLDFTARCVMGGAPLWLSWGDGASAKRYLVNDDLKPALAAGDKSAFHRALADALDRLIAHVEMTTRHGRA